MNNKLRNSVLLVVLFLLAGVLLVACDGDEEDVELSPEELTVVAEDTIETPGVDDLVEEDQGLENDPTLDEQIIESEPQPDADAPLEEDPDPNVGVDQPADEPGLEPIAPSSALLTTNALLEATVTTGVGDAGDVLDALIDAEGRIRYLVISPVDAPQQATAVTWENLEAPAANAEPVFVYGGDEAALQDEPAIDATTLDQEGGVLTPSDLGLEAEANRLFQISEPDYRLRSSGNGGEEAGEIESFLIDVQQGRVVYIAADLGDLLEGAESTVALPWEQLSFDQEAGQFVVNVDQQVLQQAPPLDADQLESGSWVAEATAGEIRGFWDN